MVVRQICINDKKFPKSAVFILPLTRVCYTQLLSNAKLREVQKKEIYERIL